MKRETKRIKRHKEKKRKENEKKRKPIFAHHIVSCALCLVSVQCFISSQRIFVYDISDTFV